jgi:4'-phosphopantetheinyl transferase
MSLDEPAWPSAELHASLEPTEHERAARFRFEEHRKRFVHGRGLLRHLLGRLLALPPAQLRFDYGPQGKPQLATGRGAALDFNFSHSGPWALLGISDGAAIGVDIELPRAVPELTKIARQHFAAGEQRALAALPASDQPAAFLAGWTRKEAFVKALGGGLAVPLDSFEVTLDPLAAAQLVHSADPAHPAAAFTLWAAQTPLERAWVAAAIRSPAVEVSGWWLR